MTPWKILYQCVAVALVLFIIGCSKKNNNVTAKPSQQDTSFIYGVMQAGKLFTIGISNDTSDVETQGWAFFYNDSVNRQQLYIGTVFLNSDSLYYKGEYIGGYAKDYDDSVNWSVFAPAYGLQFVYRMEKSFPSYIDRIPDSVAMLNGITFNFSAANTNGADSAIVSIVGSGISKACSGTVGTVTFTASELGTVINILNLSTGSVILNFEVVTFNTVTKVYAGKHYKFVNLVEINKQVFFY